MIVDQKEGSLSMRSFLNKQHWFPVAFNAVLWLMPSSSAGGGVQRNWGPHIFDF